MLPSHLFELQEAVYILALPDSTTVEVIASPPCAWRTRSPLLNDGVISEYGSHQELLLVFKDGAL